MLRFIILLMVSFMYQTSSSQTNIEVEYKIIVDTEDSYIVKLSENDYSKGLIENDIEKIDDYRFNLLINDSISSFYLSKESENQKSPFTENSTKFVFTANYNGAVYNVNQSFYSFDPNIKVFSINNYNFEWEILSETKEIDGFTAYKAKSVITIKNPAGYFSFPIVAWFCPQLPYSYGPLYFDGLPGLILQLKYRAVTYQATKINLKSDLKIDLELFNQHKKLSLDEYMKYFDEKINN